MTTPSITPRRNPRRLKTLALIALLTLLLIALTIAAIRLRKNRTHWTLYQIPPVGKFQAMSYVLITPQNHLLVVDGGWEDDGPNLANFIRAHGNAVAAWFLTHAHPDHEGALAAILRSPAPPKIDTIYASLPTDDFVREHEPMYTLDLLKLRSALKAANKSIHEVHPGDTFSLDGLLIQILGAKNPELHINAINNSSVVFRVTGRKSILFTGDLGQQGGDKILNGPYRNLLHANYVQMAHHGQAGVAKSFYEAVKPDCCLWPTPRWLWENDFWGKGPDTGPWKTLETRKWIEDMGIKRNIISMNGLAEIKE